MSSTVERVTHQSEYSPSEEKRIKALLAAEVAIRDFFQDKHWKEARKEARRDGRPMMAVGVQEVLDDEENVLYTFIRTLSSAPRFETWVKIDRLNDDIIDEFYWQAGDPRPYAANELSDDAIDEIGNAVSVLQAKSREE